MLTQLIFVTGEDWDHGTDITGYDHIVPWSAVRTESSQEQQQGRIQDPSS